MDQSTSVAKANLLELLRQLLEQSGDPDEVAQFDLDSWFNSWIGEPLAELDGQTPEYALSTASGRDQVKIVLERMRGGLPG